jgi:hypothetical protein
MTTSKSDVPSEIAFLIELPQRERRSDQPPTYWGFEEGYEGWTCEIDQATRFKSRAEAEDAARGCAIIFRDYEVVEHAWTTSLPPQQSGGGT